MNGFVDWPECVSSNGYSLNTMPFDVLLTIAAYLDLAEIHTLQFTCKSLYDFCTTRFLYRRFAENLLRRCRPLPLNGFNRYCDLDVPDLILAVSKAQHFELSWRQRGPRPLGDKASMDEPGAPRTPWYIVNSSPQDEDVDWLSPITKEYSICSTKSGRVICWDVRCDKLLAEWSAGRSWELWKCRVEFEDNAVYFAMAKFETNPCSHDDSRIMQFKLMRLGFEEDEAGKLVRPPSFDCLSEFKTTGVVMNIFLLDPIHRLLAAFVWIAVPNTIGLFVLTDWGKREYIFIDTGIDCILSSNWSCILYGRNLVIHSEEPNAAHQYIYPLCYLANYVRILETPESLPAISARVEPITQLRKRYIFPEESPRFANSDDDDTIADQGPINPFPMPPWYPESAHFVRQWWPTVPGAPRASCTVILLTTRDRLTRAPLFVIAQHYFKVPLYHPSDEETWSDMGVCMIDGGPPHAPAQSVVAPEVLPISEEEFARLRIEDSARDKELMRMWYVGQPFEPFCVMDAPDQDDIAAGLPSRPRPLLAVDFGHAVWIEWTSQRDKALRFVTFPAFDEDGTFPTSAASSRKGKMRCARSSSKECEPAQVYTLEVPEGLDLGDVDTINIDQSQGDIILSVKEGKKVFFLSYE
ncbi:hypothetical protein FISHEDRAFT_44867 [Fistulina hepatica ATCC 64428]|uniref:F-box domain-containing protein n=1 Tax=Fistulina hepatica ATCC 64428 TaxID=1128425 RepID=A0A0D7ACH8_9AGAR|nr:hypothetical protein FISHEDRAFT_44867 [Fistulina hepatica ATCC 64428]